MKVLYLRVSPLLMDTYTPTPMLFRCVIVHFAG